MFGVCGVLRLALLLTYKVDLCMTLHEGIAQRTASANRIRRVIDFLPGQGTAQRTPMFQWSLLHAPQSGTSALVFDR